MSNNLIRKFGSKSIEIQDWFLGLITKPTVERYLKKEGEYLVRTREKNGGLEFVVSVKSGAEGGCVDFIIIYKDGNGWTLEAEPVKAFGTIVELIEYYAVNKLPGKGGYLQYPFKKPKWFIRHESIAYDSEKDLIGTGNFCDVYEGKLYGKISVALKVCHGPTGEKQSANETERINDAKESLIREACLMANFKHPNIVRFHGICCDVPPICIVMEKCTGGSLDIHLQQWTNKITTGERMLYSLETAKGMCYLQEKNLIHRDLAARNCLISKYGIIKIADFGLSQLVNEIAGEPTKQRVPVRWMAPETIRKDPKYSVKSDVWSYGVLLYEIYNNGIKPWPNWDVRRCATYIRQGNMPDMPERTPAEIVDLVNECWNLDLAKRCDFKYIVKKLTFLQSIYTAPKPEHLTIANLRNVKTMTEKEAEARERKSEEEKEFLSRSSPRSSYSNKMVADMMTRMFSVSETESSTTELVDRSAKLARTSRDVIAKRRRKEREAEILSDDLLEYIEEIMKVFRVSSAKHKASKRKHTRRKKHSRKIRKNHEESAKCNISATKSLSRESMQNVEARMKSSSAGENEELENNEEASKSKTSNAKETRKVLSNVDEVSRGQKSLSKQSRESLYSPENLDQKSSEGIHK